LQTKLNNSISWISYEHDCFDDLAAYKDNNTYKENVALFSKNPLNIIKRNISKSYKKIIAKKLKNM
jgi:hypothetical protein